MVIDLDVAEMLSGTILHPNATILAQFSAFVELNNNIEKDPEASFIMF